jgi:DNA-directed RNA polymerase specialized sigma24 family protein
MSSSRLVRSRLARSPLSIAEECFTTLCTHPHPLAVELDVLRAAIAAQPATDTFTDTPIHDPASNVTGAPFDSLTDGVAEEMAGVAVFADPDTGAQLVALDDVRRWVRRPGTSNRVKNAVWALLAERAHRHGGAWTIACVALALPYLVSTSTQLSDADPATRGELDAELLTGLLSALHRLDPDTPMLWPRLQIAARRAGLTWLRQQTGTRPGLREADFDSAPPPPASGHPDLVLAAAVRAGVISTGEAGLILETRLELTDVSEVADRLGISLEALFKRRRRAELRLAAALRETLLDPGDATDPVAAHVLRKNPARAPRPRPVPAHAPTPAPEFACPETDLPTHSYPQQDNCPQPEPQPEPDARRDSGTRGPASRTGRAADARRKAA